MTTSSPRDLADLRESIEAACLEGLIDTPHGWRYRPAKGADAVLAVVGPHVEALEAQVEEWRETALKFSDDYHAELDLRIDAEAQVERVRAVVDGYHDVTLQPGEFVTRLRAALAPQPAATEEGRP